MIFLDTDFFINLYIETNENHERAKEVYNLIENKAKIISNLVIMEVITVLNVRLKKDYDFLLKVHDELNNNYDVINDTTFHAKGFKILLKEFKRNNERIPLFDSVYMVLMNELGIKEIASFDKHFDNKEGIVRVH